MPNIQDRKRMDFSMKWCKIWEIIHNHSLIRCESWDISLGAQNRDEKSGVSEKFTVHFVAALLEADNADRSAYTSLWV